MIQADKYKATQDMETDMGRHTHMCALKHKEHYRSNVHFVHKIDLLRGVTDLKKPVTCETVLNLQREKKEVLEKVVDGLWEKKSTCYGNRAMACKRAVVSFLSRSSLMILGRYHLLLLSKIFLRFFFSS